MSIEERYGLYLEVPTGKGSAGEFSLTEFEKLRGKISDDYFKVLEFFEDPKLEVRDGKIQLANKVTDAIGRASLVSLEPSQEMVYKVWLATGKPNLFDVVCLASICQPFFSEFESYFTSKLQQIESAIDSTASNSQASAMQQEQQPVQQELGWGAVLGSIAMGLLSAGKSAAQGATSEERRCHRCGRPMMYNQGYNCPRCQDETGFRV